MKSSFIQTIRLIKNDIIKIKNVDIIVTSSNENLMGNKNKSYWRFNGRINVDGAIRNESNEEELDLMLKDKVLKQGDVIITNATGNLKNNFKFVIHTVVPDGAYGYNNNNSDNILKQCYINSLKAADELICECSIVFPALGCGVKEWSNPKAADIAYKAISEIKLKYINKVFIVCIDSNTFNTFKKVGDKILVDYIQTEKIEKIEYQYIRKS